MSMQVEYTHRRLAMNQRALNHARTCGTMTDDKGYIYLPRQQYIQQPRQNIHRIHPTTSHKTHNTKPNNSSRRGKKKKEKKERKKLSTKERGGSKNYAGTNEESCRGQQLDPFAIQPKSNYRGPSPSDQKPRKPRGPWVDSRPAKRRHCRNELSRRRRSLSRTTMSPNQGCRKKKEVWADQFLPDVWYDCLV